MQPNLENFMVGDFRVEPSLNRMVRDEQYVRLTHKTMKVLLCLVDRPDQVVRREELIAEVWDGATVTEDVLNRAIADLRKAFGDRPTAPRFIETIPKVGYRLVASVAKAARPSQSDDDDESSTELGDRVATTDPAPPVPSSWRWPLGMLAAALIVLVIVAMRFSSNPRVLPQGGMPLQVTPLTSFPGFEMQPRVSPDGTRVAFIRQIENEENVDIYVTGIDGEGLLRLTSDPAADLSPAWSPDGSKVLFIRHHESAEERCTIYAVSALGGGPERRLAGCGKNVSADLVWSPDGRWLAFSDRVSEEESFGIYLLSPESLERRLLVAPDGQHWGDRAPSFSPDSQHVAFTRSTSMATQDLFRIPASGGEITRLTTDARAIRGHSWSADGRSIVLASDRGGIAGLWRIAVSGGELQWLASAPAWSIQPTGSPRDDRLVFVSRSSSSDIYRLDLLAKKAEPEPWIVSTHEDFQPRPDRTGRRLAFVSRRSGHTEIWVNDGDENLRLTSFGGPFTNAPRFSPDGRSIVFDARPDGHADVFVIDAEGGAARLLAGGLDNELDPSWSKTGDWVYFGANRGGLWQIWRVPAAGGEAIQVTHDGGYSAIESPSGEWLYFTRYDQPGLFRVPTAGGNAMAVPGAASWTDLKQVYLDSKGFTFIDQVDKQRWIARLDPDSGKVERLRTFRGDSANDLAISPDGRFLYYTVVGDGNADLMLARPAQ